MKKYISVLLFFIIILVANFSNATITIESSQAVSGQEYTLKVKSDTPLGSYTVLLDDIGSLEFVTSSGQEGSGKKIITGSSVTGETKLASFTFKVPENISNLNVKLRVIGMETPNLLPMPDQEINSVIQIKNDNITTKPIKEINSETQKYIAFVLQTAEDLLTKKDLQLAYKDKKIETEDSILKNGSKIYIDGQERKIILYGDANCDGKISILDSIKILNYSKQKETMSQEEVYASNIRKNNKVDIMCAVKILNIIKGKIPYSNILET